MRDELALYRLSLALLGPQRLLVSQGLEDRPLETLGTTSVHSAKEIPAATCHTNVIDPVTRLSHLPNSQRESIDQNLERIIYNKLLWFKKRQLENFAQSLLVVATLAGTVTLSSIISRPNSEELSGINQFAFSSALFLGSVMGCILLIISIQINVPLTIIQVEGLVIGALLFAAFYTLLHASSLVQGSRDSFILGSILYLSFGLLIIVFSILSIRGRNKSEDEETRGSFKDNHIMKNESNGQPTENPPTGVDDT